MIGNIYKTRREAEENRNRGDSIYFVSDKGYYLVPAKSKQKNYIPLALGIGIGFTTSIFLMFVTAMVMVSSPVFEKQFDTLIINDDLTDFENVTITQTVKEELKEINCLANSYQWNTQTQQYEEIEIFEQPPKCYEIIERTLK